MKIKGIIFDLDGTLLDTIEDIASILNSVLKSHNFPAHDTKAYRGFIGGGFENTVRVILPEDKQEKEIVSELVLEAKQKYLENWINKTRPFAGITDLLKNLISKNLKLAVFTNKQDDVAKKSVEHFFSQIPFDPVMGLKPDSIRKPDPHGALQIARNWGIPPEGILFVGDMHIDLITAQNAAMKGIGALWGYQDNQIIKKYNAFAFIDHPIQLLDYLA